MEEFIRHVLKEELDGFFAAAFIVIVLFFQSVDEGVFAFVGTGISFAAAANVVCHVFINDYGLDSYQLDDMPSELGVKRFGNLALFQVQDGSDEMS